MMTDKKILDMMTDKELLDQVEAAIIEKMLNGCLIMDHLGERHHDIGGWSISFRVDTVSRLIDIAKDKK